MHPLSPSVLFFLSLATVESAVTRRFDSGLGGLGFSDFQILYRLSQAKGEKLRRIDLADQVGLTASGITRLLAPMEKIGLVTRAANARDARVSEVVLAPGGKRKLQESLEDAERLAESLLESVTKQQLRGAAEVLAALGA